MRRMIARRRNQTQAAPGADTVLFGLSLPDGSILHSGGMQVHLSSSVENSLLTVAYYGVEGWILPVHDVDAGVSYENLFDILVPKDSGTSTIDLDSGTADVTNFFEPGTPQFAKLLDVGLRPKKVYQRLKMLHQGNSSFSYFDTGQVTPLWIANDDFYAKFSGPYRITNPSVLVFALSSPNVDATTGTTHAPLSEYEWDQIKYVDHVLERALISLFGIVESGAETPWAEATALLVKQLEPTMHELNAGAYVSLTYRAFIDAQINFEVEGELAKGVITTGR